MLADERLRTWREFSTTTGRLTGDILALATELRAADVPAGAYFTFHEAGAQYRVTARWTVVD